MNQVEEIPDWSTFYTALGQFAPAFLTGVHREFAGFIELEARETDSFWSGGLESTLRAFWDEDPRTAVSHVLTVWLENVKQHLHDVMGPSSLMPFDLMGFTEEALHEIRASIAGIALRIDPHLINALVNAASGKGIANYRPGSDFQIRAVVETISKAREGDLIRTLEFPWRIIISKMRDNWNTAYELDSRLWEELIAAALDSAGYDEVILTPRSGDYGRDVVAVKRGVGSVRILSSVKAYKRGHLVKHDDVRALAGVLLGDPSATKGIVMTTSDFAPTILQDPFIAPLVPFRLELMNGRQLHAWLDQVSGYQL